MTGLDEVLITAELASRPSRSPDYEAESRALGLLAQEMATDSRSVLQKCAELVIELCHADSAGISILEPGGAGGMLRWHAATGAFASNLHGTMPQEASPCGTVMERDCVLLFKEAERVFPALRDVEPRIYENLLTPWHAKGKAVGTLWAIKHTPEGRFDAEDARLLQSLSRFAAAAFQMHETELALASDLANAERLRSLSDRLVSEESLQSIYEAILSATIAITQADAGTVQLYDPATQTLELIVSQGFTRTITDYFHRVDAGSRTACGIALKTGEYAFADFPEEVADLGCQLLTGEGILSAVAYPLMSRTGAPVGMLNAHWRQAGHRANDRELRFLGLLARQGADLIEHWRSQSALRESEERFRQFAHAAAEGAWIRDAETLTMEYVSPAATRIYGVEPHALLDGVQRWASLVLPEDRDAALAHLEQSHRGEVVSHQFRIQRPSDGTFRWIRSTVFPLLNAEGRVQRIGALDADVTEAKLAVEHQGVLLAELQHRVRNIMAMIRSMARRSADGAADVNEYRASLDGRLLALARVQALLTRQANTGGSLRDIVESEVGAQAHGGSQHELVGPDVHLSPKAVEVLTLALHELATNALKYGALSVPEGRLLVEWAPFEKRGRTWLAIDWAEAGAPSRGPITRRGFGSDLIEGKIPYELGGAARISIEPDGARCHLEFPLQDSESILETDAPSPTVVCGGTLDMTGAPDLTGRNVLVVEDDYYIASDTATALRGAGAAVLGPCPSEDTALDLLETATPTHAVLDLNLGGGGPQFEIARALKEHGVPFIFLTGYDPDAVPPDFAGVVRLQKPVTLSSIVEAVAQL